MSLIADQIFFEALKSNESLMATIGSRLYSTAIPLPDEDADNVPVPYVILTFDGMTNDGLTKDSYEGDTDSVNIGIEIVAKTRQEVGSIAQTIRSTVREYFENASPDDELYDLVPEDYQLTAQAIQYDSMKPCFWQVLNYQCDTNV